MPFVAVPSDLQHVPYWLETLLRCYVVPAAKPVGIAKQIGWHSFRRTFATLLKGCGEDVNRPSAVLYKAKLF